MKVELTSRICAVFVHAIRNQSINTGWKANPAFGLDLPVSMVSGLVTMVYRKEHKVELLKRFQAQDIDVMCVEAK